MERLQTARDGCRDGGLTTSPLYRGRSSQRPIHTDLTPYKLYTGRSIQRHNHENWRKLSLQIPTVLSIRNTILKKLFPPENRSAVSVAKEYNISVTTLYGWKARMKAGTLTLEEGIQSNRERPLAEKLSLLL